MLSLLVKIAYSENKPRKFFVWASSSSVFETVGLCDTHEAAVVLATKYVLDHGGRIADYTKPKEVDQ